MKKVIKELLENPNKIRKIQIHFNMFHQLKVLVILYKSLEQKQVEVSLQQPMDTKMEVKSFKGKFKVLKVKPIDQR